MFLTQFDNNKFYLSDDYTDKENITYEFGKFLLRMFTHRKKFEQIKELYGQIYHLDGQSIIHAHGYSTIDGVNPDKWYFRDNGSPHEVQKIIDTIDGTCLSIMLLMCNENDYEITSKHSLVLHPRDIVSRASMDGQQSRIRMYVPKIGYLDTNFYRINKYIASLEDVLGNKRETEPF